jgi:hypothetical protein
LSTIDFKEIASQELNGYKIDKKLVTVSSAKRHVISINNIKAQGNVYKENNTLKSRELITKPVKSIALFCNEYVPEHFPDSEYFKYVFTINGVDHEVIPINSDRSGKKIIRTTDYNSPSEYVIYLSEEIKSAFLSIVIKAPSANETPYISNLKILIGGNENV